MTLEQRKTEIPWVLHADMAALLLYKCAEWQGLTQLVRQEQQGSGPMGPGRVHLGDERSCPCSWKPWRRRAELHLKAHSLVLAEQEEEWP